MNYLSMTTRNRDTEKNGASFLTCHHVNTDFIYTVNCPYFTEYISCT